MLRSFPNIVKQILKYLPRNDYPVLHSCLFCQIWLTFISDKSLTSMRDLFYLLNRSVLLSLKLVSNGATNTFGVFILN